MEVNNCALLLTSVKDVELLKTTKNVEGLACEYPIIQLSKSHDLECFLDEADLKPDLHRLVGELISKWYRDENDKDVISHPNISIGALLQYRLAIRFANALRYYMAFSVSVKKFDKLMLSTHLPDALNRAASFFTDNIGFFESNYHYDEVVTSAPERGLINQVPVHKLSRYARLIQKPFLNRVKNKVLVFADWTFRFIDNDDCLSFNAPNPLRGFYLSNGDGCKGEAEKYFPLTLKYELVRENLTRIFDTFEYDSVDKKNWIDLFLDILEDEYQNDRIKLIQTYSIYSEAINYYSPSMILVPGYAHPWYNTLYWLAQLHNIPIMFVLDGYPFFIDKYLFQKNTYNNAYMIKYWGAMGKYGADLYKSIFKLQDNDLIKIAPPILDFYRKKEKESSDNVIILFSYGVIHNPACRWDYRYKYILDIVNCLDKNGIKNISVKMKTGTYKKRQSDETVMLRYLLDQGSFEDVEIIEGELHQHLQTANFIIGQIGTATIESIYMNVPFYVYEPYELGMSDHMINDSSMPLGMVARNVAELAENINENNFVKLDKKKLSAGINIHDVNFSALT